MCVSCFVVVVVVVVCCCFYSQKNRQREVDRYKDTYNNRLIHILPFTQALKRRFICDVKQEQTTVCPSIEGGRDAPEPLLAWNIAHSYRSDIKTFRARTQLDLQTYFLVKKKEKKKKEQKKKERKKEKIGSNWLFRHRILGLENKS